MIRIVLAGLLLTAAASAQAGRLPGPGKKTAQVQGFAAVTYQAKFKPGEPAVVRLIGDGDAPLALGVFDAAGKAVTVDVKNTDRFELRWTPTTDEPYTIKVKNRGGVPVRFVLRTN